MGRPGPQKLPAQNLGLGTRSEPRLGRTALCSPQKGIVSWGRKHVKNVECVAAICASRQAPRHLKDQLSSESWPTPPLDPQGGEGAIPGLGAPAHRLAASLKEAQPGQAPGRSQWPQWPRSRPVGFRVACDFAEKGARGLDACPISTPALQCTGMVRPGPRAPACTSTHSEPRCPGAALPGSPGVSGPQVS